MGRPQLPEQLCGPFRALIPDDKKALALYSFSEYGLWAYYGSFEDTTKARLGHLFWLFATSPS